MFVFMLLLFDVFAAVGSRRQDFILMFPAMGCVLGIYFVLAILGDASLTNSGVSIAMSAQDWTALQWFSIVVAASQWFAALYRIELML